MPTVARNPLDEMAKSGDIGSIDNAGALVSYPTPAVTVDHSKMDPTSDSAYQAFLRRQGVSSGRANQAIAERLDRLNQERTRFLEDQQLGTTRTQYATQLREDRAFEDAERARQDIAAGREAGQFRMDDIARMRAETMANLAREQQVGTRNTNVNAASRGLFQSSQRMADLSDLEQEIIRMRAGANKGYDANVRDTEASLRGLDRQAGDIDSTLARVQRDAAVRRQDYGFDTERERIRYEQDYERQVAQIEASRAAAAAAAAAARQSAFAGAQERTAANFSALVSPQMLEPTFKLDGVEMPAADYYRNFWSRRNN